jgi:hypothetical protein
VYVVGVSTANVFAIRSSSVIEEILDASAGGNGAGLSNPLGIAADAAGNVYVTGYFSRNAYSIVSALCPGS